MFQVFVSPDPPLQLRLRVGIQHALTRLRAPTFPLLLIAACLVVVVTPTFAAQRTNILQQLGLIQAPACSVAQGAGVDGGCSTSPSGAESTTTNPAINSYTDVVRNTVTSRVVPKTSDLQAVPGGPAIPAGPNNYFVATDGVDSYASDGSYEHPWATITWASQHVAPGKTVYVEPGTYSENVWTSSYGTSPQPIVFVSLERWAAKIVSHGSSIAWKNTGSYVIIDGFDVTGTDAPGQPSTDNLRTGIGNYGSNVLMIHNRVHDIPALGCITPTNPGGDVNGGAGIGDSSYTASNNIEDSNWVYAIGAPDCTQVHGIYHANAGGKVVNNISYGNGGSGIQLWHAATAVVVSNNLAFNNFDNGMNIGAGDAPGGVTADNLYVTNNILVNNGGYGIMPAGVLGSHNVYSNNILYGNATGPFRYVANQTDVNTIAADPSLIFVNFMIDGSGDYHLKSDSPAIGAGTSVGQPPLHDYDGASRPNKSGNWAIGPYELSTRVPKPPVRP